MENKLGRFKDYQGQKYGCLTAIKLCNPPKKNGLTNWQFKCDCGNFVEKPIAKVKDGSISSCGCLRRKHCAENNRRIGQACKVLDDKDWFKLIINPKNKSYRKLAEFFKISVSSVGNYHKRQQELLQKYSLVEFDLYDSPSDWIASGISGIYLTLTRVKTHPYQLGFLTDNHKLWVWWEKGKDLEVWQYLVDLGYGLKNGILNLPKWQNNIIPQHVLLNTILAIPRTRTLSGFIKNSEKFESPYYELETFAHLNKVKQLCTKKGIQWEKTHSLTSTYHPNSTAGMDITKKHHIQLLFAPLTWGFYEIQKKVAESKKINYISDLSVIRYKIIFGNYAIICPRLDQVSQPLNYRPNQETFKHNFLSTALADYAFHNDCFCHGYLYQKASNRAPQVVEAINPDKLPDNFFDYCFDIWKLANDCLPNKLLENKSILNYCREKIIDNCCSGKRFYEDLFSDNCFVYDMQFNHKNLNLLMRNIGAKY